MAKQLKQDPITDADLIEFVDDQSDFSFEIQTLRVLIDRGFSCEHGGTYDDPATEKPREFDIRATQVFGKLMCPIDGGHGACEKPHAILSSKGHIKPEPLDIDEDLLLPE